MSQLRRNAAKKYNKCIFYKNSTEGEFTIQNRLKKNKQFTVRFFFKTKKKKFIPCNENT